MSQPAAPPQAPAPRRAPGHWLAEMARRGGLLKTASLDIPRSATLAEAWSQTARACGLDEAALARKVAIYYRLEVADLALVDARAVKLLSQKIARQYGVVPLRQDDRNFSVATADPTNLDMEQAVRFASGRNPVMLVAPPTAITRAIEDHYSPDRAIESLMRGMRMDAEDVQLISAPQAEEVRGAEIESGPVVKLVNLILRYAVTERASDIHIEPGRDHGVVRLRVDGVMHEYLQLAMPAVNRVVSRIKVLAHLDITDRLRPQDGRVRIQVAERAYDLRISTIPTRDSEKAVIRILGGAGAERLGDLSMPDHELSRMRHMLAYRNGIVIVTGPTGSGKTTTLYAGIRELATGAVNIMTVEDPVEYELQGITQMQVEPKRNVTFATALRAILRQDPDVILVGEIRDLETAEIAVQASMTGHLVLATLHTNDAVGAIARLTDLGLDRKSIASTLRGVLAQRLVRRVCAACATPVAGNALSDEEAQLAAQYGLAPTMRANGCNACGLTGYRGRLPVQETLLASPAFLDLVSQGESDAHLLSAAIENGMRTLLENGLYRVREGSTTLSEVDRVLGESTAHAGASASGSAAGAPAGRSSPSLAAASSGSLAAAPAGPAPGTGPEAAAAAPHVLVVDDEDVSRKLARSLLEKAGCVVTEARDGAEAWRRIEFGNRYTLVLTDLSMPELDGRGLLARIRQGIQTASLPVIVFTASEDSESELMDAGADDYIRKPIDPLRFVSRMKAALRRAAD